MSTHSESTLVLGPDDAGRLVSAEQFAEAEFVEPWTYEREAGRLVVMAPEGQDHVEGASPWLQRLVLYWSQHPEVVAFVVPQAWIRVDDGTDRIGDIGVYLVAESPQPPIPDRVPDLMFELTLPTAEAGGFSVPRGLPPMRGSDTLSPSVLAGDTSRVPDCPAVRNQPTALLSEVGRNGVSDLVFARQRSVYQFVLFDSRTGRLISPRLKVGALRRLSVISPGSASRNRDYDTKRRDYERLGVKECVIIDRPEQAVSVFNQGPQGFQKRVLKPGNVYQSPLLPGLAIPLNDVL